MQLPVVQHQVLERLARADGPVEVQALAADLAVDQAQVAAACAELSQRGLIEVAEQAYDEVRLGREAEPYAIQRLPEWEIVRVLARRGGRCPITEIPEHCALNAAQVGQTLRWLAQRGWANKSGGDLVLTDAGRDAASDERLTTDEEVIRALALRAADPERPAARREEFAPAALELLEKRKGFLVVRSRTQRRVGLTEAGRRLVAAGVTSRPTVTRLTPELLADGSWRQVDLRPYDVKLAARRLYPGKEHAFQRTLDKVRRTFLEMGFTEIASPWVESSFWDFDALFQPQDHPARDMQDTFYVARPARCRLPDEALVERVGRTHEDGGQTGSTGWQYRWSRALAERPVLRTHTTAATIRALAAHGRAAAGRSLPGKYFAIGPVFRRETVDYKHLPIFHQVDGIIVDPHASLATLKGTLAAFYGKMGFSKVEFRPSFFPYTEPSAEVLLWLESRRDWVEMGGSGVFRPEVTRPLGIVDRVLAWGLGLERLAMMIHGLGSIGDIYFAHMPWLREAPLCRS